MRMGGELVGDLEALGLGVGGAGHAVHEEGGTSMPGTLEATKRMPPTERRMQIEGIRASRSLSPVSWAARMKRSSSSGR